MTKVFGQVGRSIVGGLLVVLGVVLIPLPGPGLLVVLAGLVILARDYAWAARLVEKVRARAGQAAGAAKRYFGATP
jgi:uncharacterized protein (TIGR02611 family)